MERNASAAEREWSVCQVMVPEARASGAYLLLPAPETPSGSVYRIGAGTAGTTVPLAPKPEETHAKLRLTTKAGSLEIMDADRSVLDQVLRVMLHAE